MNKINELINKLCPNGVEFKTLEKICGTITTGKLNANAMVENGEYPFFTCDSKPFKIDKYAFDEEAILISGNGSQVGHINYYKGKFNAYQRTYVIYNFKNVNVKYLLHYLKGYLKEYILKNCKKGSVPYITLPMLQNFKIAVPPMEVQNEIVHILDDFTLLSAELSAELKARQQQYEYYCSKLLKLENEEKKMLNDITNNISSGKNKERLPNGIYPVYGSTGIISSTNDAVYEKEQILIARVGANAGYVHIASGSYDVSDNTLIVDLKQDVNMKYVYYQLSNMNLHQYAKGGGQPLITAGEMKRISISIPKIERQNKIVEILDKFYKIVNDITEGLPAEIEARKKQYEYYRDKLLTFKELKVEK